MLSPIRPFPSLEDERLTEAGDGSTDDTAAINAAILAGNPCNEGCVSASLIRFRGRLLTVCPGIHHQNPCYCLLPPWGVPDLIVHQAGVLYSTHW
jgi:hypothetical protein